MTERTALIYDVVIVGAGPAGLCAALYAHRGMLTAVTIERGAPGGELLNTDLIEDYIGFESIKCWELAQKMTEHAKKFGAEIVTDTVERIGRDADGWFDVHTARGNVYRSQAVILTAGGTPIKLGVPGEKEFAGKGVSYCAVCDGAFFKGERLAVVGGGDAAVEEADYLTRYASKVHLVHRRDEFRASKLLQERAFTNPKIQVIRNTIVPEIVGNTKGVTHAVLEDTGTGERSNLDVGGVFIFAGFKPNTQLVEGHVDHDDGGDRGREVSQVPARAAGRRQGQAMKVAQIANGVFAENCYLIVDEPTRQSVIVDPGEEAGLILHKIEEAGAQPVAILLTHAHVDHVLGVEQVARKTGAIVWLHPADRPLYDAVGEQAGWFGLVPPEEQPPPDRDLVAGQQLQVGGLSFDVRHTPGHSPGSVCFVGHGAVFSGDVLFAGSCAGTVCPGGTSKP